MNEKSRMSCSFEPGEENHELTDAQIEKIAGGDIPRMRIERIYQIERSGLKQTFLIIPILLLPPKNRFRKRSVLFVYKFILLC